MGIEKWKIETCPICHTTHIYELNIRRSVVLITGSSKSLELVFGDSIEDALSVQKIRIAKFKREFFCPSKYFLKKFEYEFAMRYTNKNFIQSIEVGKVLHNEKTSNVLLGKLIEPEPFSSTNSHDERNYEEDRRLGLKEYFVKHPELIENGLRLLEAKLEARNEVIDILGEDKLKRKVVILFIRKTEDLSRTEDRMDRLLIWGEQEFGDIRGIIIGSNIGIIDLDLFYGRARVRYPVEIKQLEHDLSIPDPFKYCGECNSYTKSKYAICDSCQKRIDLTF